MTTTRTQDPRAKVVRSDQPQAPFFRNGYTQVGRDHLFGDMKGHGNQDCFGIRETPRGIILVSSDGCGESPDSGTGSKAMVRIVLNVAEALLNQEAIPDPEQFAEVLQAQILERFRDSALPLSKDGDVTGIVGQSYLATVLVAVMTPVWTAIFGCGDGYYALNGNLRKLEPEADNHPMYLAYLLFNPIPTRFQAAKLQVLEVIDTAEVKHLLIGTDGLEPIERGVAYQKGRFALPDLWANPNYVPRDAVVATFDELGRDEARLQPKAEHSAKVSVVLNESPGIFKDDVTFARLIFDRTAAWPELWIQYRDAYIAEQVAQSEETDVAEASGDENQNPAPSSLTSLQPLPASAAVKAPLPTPAQNAVVEEVETADDRDFEDSPEPPESRGIFAWLRSLWPW